MKRLPAAMPRLQLGDRARRAILTAWVVAWALALFWLLLQAWLMSDRWWFVPPAVVLPLLALLAGRALVRAHLAGNRLATLLFALAALAHLIPPVRQLAGAFPPSWDTTILGLVALLLALTL